MHTLLLPCDLLHASLADAGTNMFHTDPCHDAAHAEAHSGKVQLCNLV